MTTTTMNPDARMREDTHSPLPTVPSRYVGAAALHAAILAAAELAPAEDPAYAYETASRYRAGPGRASDAWDGTGFESWQSRAHFPESQPSRAEFDGPEPRDIHAECNAYADARDAWEARRDAWETWRESIEDWHGPLLRNPSADRIEFHYADAHGTRGRITVRNLRTDILRLAERVHARRDAFEGKTKRAARPGIRKGSAPHVAARAAMREADYSAALTLADSAGPVFFGRPGKPDAGALGFRVFMQCQTADACGESFTIGRDVRGGRFRISHTASGRAHGPRTGPDGFASAPLALAWLEQWAAEDGNADRLAAIVGTFEPWDQSAARAAFEIAAAASANGADTPADTDPSGPDSGPPRGDPGAAAPMAPAEPAEALTADPAEAAHAAHRRALGAVSRAALAPDVRIRCGDCGATLTHAGEHADGCGHSAPLRPAVSAPARLCLPAQCALERIAADASLRTRPILDSLADAYARAQGCTLEPWERTALHAAAARYLPDAPEAAPSGAVGGVAAEGPPSGAVGRTIAPEDCPDAGQDADPLATHSQAAEPAAPPATHSQTIPGATGPTEAHRLMAKARSALTDRRAVVAFELAAEADAETVRVRLRAVESAILACVPSRFSAGGGDIEAACAHRSAPANLKRERRMLRDALRASNPPATHSRPHGCMHRADGVTETIGPDEWERRAARATITGDGRAFVDPAYAFPGTGDGSPRTCTAEWTDAAGTGPLTISRARAAYLLRAARSRGRFNLPAVREGLHVFRIGAALIVRTAHKGDPTPHRAERERTRLTAAAWRIARRAAADGPRPLSEALRAQAAELRYRADNMRKPAGYRAPGPLTAEAAERRRRHERHAADYCAAADALERGSAGAEWSELQAAATARRAQAAFLAGRFESIPLAHPTDPERYALAGPDASGATPARLTWFDADGPVNHSGFACTADAIAEALGMGYRAQEAAAMPHPLATHSQTAPAADPPATHSDAEPCTGSAGEWAERRFTAEGERAAPDASNPYRPGSAAATWWERGHERAGRLSQDPEISSADPDPRSAEARAAVDADALREAANALHCGRVYPVAIFEDGRIRRELRISRIEHSGERVTLTCKRGHKSETLTVSACSALHAIQRGERAPAVRRPADAPGRVAERIARRRLALQNECGERGAGIEWAYSPSTGAVGMRGDASEAFRIPNVRYPMFGRAELVADWVSVGISGPPATHSRRADPRLRIPPRFERSAIARAFGGGL